MKLTFLTKLTAGGLIALAIALWTQWLSGDPAYTSFPPGPVLFIGVAAIIIFGARWWWTPMMGSLIGLLVTSGWFARLPQAMLRLNHPNEVGKFATGIFIGSSTADHLAPGNRYRRIGCDGAELSPCRRTSQTAPGWRAVSLAGFSW